MRKRGSAARRSPSTARRAASMGSTTATRSRGCPACSAPARPARGPGGTARRAPPASAQQVSRERAGASSRRTAGRRAEPRRCCDRLRRWNAGPPLARARRRQLWITVPTPIRAKPGIMVLMIDSPRLQGHDIVCVGFADWDTELWTNQHHLMSRLARENRVLFVESLGLRRPQLAGRDLTRIWRRLRRGLAPPRRSTGYTCSRPLCCRCTAPASLGHSNRLLPALVRRASPPDRPATGRSCGPMFPRPRF